MTDYWSVECETCRESLSARLDGETEAEVTAETDSHLSGCLDCQEWLAAATALSRTIRVRPTDDVPDLVGAVMAAVPSVPHRRARLRSSVRGRGSRIALGVIAAAQTVLGVAQVFGVHVGMGTSTPHDSSMPGHIMTADSGMTGHLFNESTAWNLAVGLGLLWAAIRPRAVAGMVPVLAVFVAALTGFVANDLAHGSVTPTRVLSHLLLVVALGVLLWVRRDIGDHGDPTPGRMDAEDNEWPITDSQSNHDPSRVADGRRKGRHLRPASRRAA